MIVLLAGCGGKSDQPQPTLRPTAVPPTPTPRSTALPDVPEAPALGNPGRPIEIQFVLRDARRSTDTVEMSNALESELLEQLDLTVDVTFIDNESAALDAICNGSANGNPSAVWVSPFSLIAAENECEAVPTLAVIRGTPPRESAGLSADIIAAATVTSLDQIAGRPFCRLDSQDVITWLYPSLIMAEQGVNPLSDLGRILDRADYLALLEAVYKGDCAAAALPAGEYEDLVDDLVDALDDEAISRDDVTAAVKVLIPAGDTTAPTNLEDWPGFDAHVIPYDVLVFPASHMIPAELREGITQIVTDFFSSRIAGSARLRVLLRDASKVMPVEHDDYDAFRSAINRSGWNMAFLE